MLDKAKYFYETIKREIIKYIYYFIIEDIKN